MKKWMIFSVFSVLVLSACQAGNDQTAYDLRNDTTNPNFMSNKTNDTNNINNVNNVSNHPDHDVGPMSDQNPNFLNLRGTSLNDASNRNNTGKDIDKARDIVNSMTNFRSKSVWINNAGDQMTVTVNTRGALNGKERDRAISRLHKKLEQALPRYDINIKER